MLAQHRIDRLLGRSVQIHPAIQIQKGKFVTVYPEESKQNDVVYPVPAWEERK